jgi:uncharacterized membrane protein YphA (DoxX/SURF4 family)
VADVGAGAALVLAGVFAVAGLAKLRRPAATGTTFRALGLPVPGVLARLVPATELGLAGALVLRPRAGGLVALAVLAAFTVVLAVAVRRGSAVRCGCFGSAGGDPVGPADLVRNALLAVLALAAVTAAGFAWPSLPALLVATTGGLIGAILLALVRVRLTTGRLFAVDLEAP